MKTVNLQGEIYHIDSDTYDFLVECLTYRNLYDSLVINEDGFSLKDSLTPAEICKVMESVLDLISGMIGEIVMDMDEDVQKKWNTGIGSALAQNGRLIDVLVTGAAYTKASIIIKTLLHSVLDFKKYLENTEIQPAAGQVSRELK